MANSRRVALSLRLEDCIALAFFLINLLLRIIFRELDRQNVSPADVLIVIPAMALLMLKELVHYFVSRSDASAKSSESPLAFIRPYWGIFRDWFPFLVILLMYYSLWGDATHLLTSHDRDHELVVLDQELFGVQASVWMQRFVSPTLTAWMQFAYFYHVLNIPVVACFVYLRRPRWRFREMMTGLIVVCFFGLLGYLLVPAVGPLYTLRDQYTVPLTQPMALFNRQVEFMDFARIRRDVFPSLHVGISFVVWLYAFRNSRRLFWIISPLILSLWISTVYLRYHYVVDVIAGLILAPLCYLLSNFLFQHFREIPVALTVPAPWVEKFPWLAAGASPASLPSKVEERQ
jgi:membrane-associated phospholipid phosphatase